MGTGTDRHVEGTAQSEGREMSKRVRVMWSTESEYALAHGCELLVKLSTDTGPWKWFVTPPWALTAKAWGTEKGSLAAKRAALKAARKLEGGK